VTIEEAQEAVEAAKRKMHDAARKLTMGAIGHTPIITAARLDMIETMLIGLMAERSQHDGTFEMKVLLELRDYWEAITEEIKS